METRKRGEWKIILISRYLKYYDTLNNMKLEAREIVCVCVCVRGQDLCFKDVLTLSSCYGSPKWFLFFHLISSYVAKLLLSTSCQLRCVFKNKMKTQRWLLYCSFLPNVYFTVDCDCLFLLFHSVCLQV